MTTKNKIERNEKGQFVKGIVPFYKGKEMPMIQKENHYKWKGGTHQFARRMLKRKGVDLTYCRICGDKKNILIHHIDGNEFNNEERNQAIICTYCHNAIHGIGKNTQFKEGHQVPIGWSEKISEANKGKHYSPSTEFKIGDKAHLGYRKQLEVTN
jgi:hypothetical protein